MHSIMLQLLSTQIIIINMSIYSGFATRNQQQTYDNYVEAVMQIIQRRLIKFYQGHHVNEDKFLSALTKLYHQIKFMQKHKYLEPKCSNSFQELIQFLKERKKQSYDGQFEDIGGGQSCFPVTVPIKQTTNYELSSKQNDKSIQSNEQLKNNIVIKQDGPYTMSTSQIKSKSISSKIPKMQVENNLRNSSITITQIPIPTQPEQQQLQHKFNYSTIMKHKQTNQHIFPVSKVYNSKFCADLNKMEIQQLQLKEKDNLEEKEIRKLRERERERDKIRKKCKSKHQMRNIGICDDEVENRKNINNQVSGLIKGYMNRLRKNGRKSRNKSRSEIEQLLNILQ